MAFIILCLPCELLFADFIVGEPLAAPALSNVTPSHRTSSLLPLTYYIKKAPLPESFFHLSNKIFLFPAALSPSEDEADAAEDFVGRLSQPYAHKAETAHNAENIGE